jgi:hypothetical protein
MDFMENPIITPCWMRHYIDGNIIFRDAAGNITYDTAELSFYRHRHAEEQDDTRPMGELPDEMIQQIDVLAELENKSNGILDVIQKEDDNVVFAPADEPNTIFQSFIDDFELIAASASLVTQLYDFVAPRGIDEPYCVQIDNGDLVVF